MLSEIALTTLEKRYLLRDEKGNLTERPDQLFSRVARAVAEVEPSNLSPYWEDKFYEILSELKFLPNTPTLMNAGKKDGQLSACYVLPIEDSMEGIFTTLKDAAIIHKTGGGTGFDFSRLRPEGAVVSNKSGVSTGPLAFCQVFDKATEVVKQGASRRGANMMNLRVDHPDILEFIDMKMTPGHMTNFNVSVTVTDAFMEALENDGTYELKHPVSGVTDTLRARFVWDKIANNAWRSAEPGIIFIDRVNRHSPYRDRIEATNPCGEQPLPPYGSCNLGSIDVSKFYRGDGFNWDELADVIETSVRFLDNVIDANVYPTPELHKHAQTYRNIGLGIMGWADLLIKAGVPYNSSEAILFAQELAEFVNKKAHKYSELLANEKGLPSGAPFKKFFGYSTRFRRNATLTTQAPTGTISMIAGCSSGIEPVFAFEMERHQMDIILTDYHHLWKEHKENGLFEREAFVDAHAVDVRTHVLMQAAFQKHCDSAISKTINLSSDSNVEDVKKAYLLAWQTGCKGITVYRDGTRGNILKRIEHEDDSQAAVEEYVCCSNPVRVKESGCESCKSCGYSVCLIS